MGWRHLDCKQHLVMNQPIGASKILIITPTKCKWRCPQQTYVEDASLACQHGSAKGPCILKNVQLDLEHCELLIWRIIQQKNILLSERSHCGSGLHFPKLVRGFGLQWGTKHMAIYPQDIDQRQNIPRYTHIIVSKPVMIRGGSNNN